jgi:hypothetical protein
LKPTNTIQEILDALASQTRQENTPLVFRLEPALIEAALNALPGRSKVFAPVIAGLTDTVQVHAAYQQLRQSDETRDSILLLVECQTAQQFRDALDTLPLRTRSGAVSIACPPTPTNSKPTSAQ